MGGWRGLARGWGGTDGVELGSGCRRGYLYQGPTLFYFYNNGDLQRNAEIQLIFTFGELSTYNLSYNILFLSGECAVL